MGENVLEYAPQEWIDKETVLNFQGKIEKAIGIPIVFVDATGKLIAKSNLDVEYCLHGIRSCEKGNSTCEEVVEQGAKLAMLRGANILKKCPYGMDMFFAPIKVRGQSIGCAVGGGVSENPISLSIIKKTAEELNLDTAELVKKSVSIKNVEKSQLEIYADLISNITELVCESFYQKYLTEKGGEILERSAHMKSDFLANMSHEIRTPMNAVIGMAQMALREDLPDTARTYVNQIVSSGKTLLTIINDILDFSKIESGKMDIQPEKYYPMSLIHDISNILMTRIGNKSLELIFDIDPSIPAELVGDSTRIKQVIVNLCNNAIKFTNEGSVTLKLYAKDKSETELLICGDVIDTGIGIKEQDKERLFSSFYQADSKRNRNIEGTGLGLAICKNFLSLMGGKIELESEYGVGSTFSFELPQTIYNGEDSVFVKDEYMEVALLVKKPSLLKQIIKDLDRLGVVYDELTSEVEVPFIFDGDVSYLVMEEKYYTEEMKKQIKEHPDMNFIVITSFSNEIDVKYPNVKQLKKPVYSFSLATMLNGDSLEVLDNGDVDEEFDFIAPDVKVLIVDDNEINLTVAEGLLKPIQMQIDTANGGKNAIEKVTYEKYDIIFMDHMMPEVDGVEATRIIRRFHGDYKNVPIIALTANAIEGTKEMFLEEGMNDFVPKPIEMKQMLKVLRKWLPADKIEKTTHVLKNEPKSYSFGNIEGLNVDAAMELLGDETLFLAVLKDYYHAINYKITNIQKYYDQEDWKNYTIEVHALKSASRQIGAIELSELAAKLEKAGNEKDIDLIKANTDKMLKIYKAYIPVLQPMFDTSQQEDDGEKKVLEDSYLIDCFEVLKESIENLDLDEMEKVVIELKKYEMDKEDSKLLMQLDEMVETMDTDACAVIIESWERYKGFI